MNTFSAQTCLIIIILLALTACDKNEINDSICTQSNWIGTYQGVGTCIGRTENVTLFITAGSLENEIIISNGKEGKTLLLDNCQVTLTEDTPLFTFPVNGVATLSGDSLHLRASTFLGISCSTTILRQ
jgi:hypothetical protein